MTEDNKPTGAECGSLSAVSRRSAIRAFGAASAGGTLALAGCTSTQSGDGGDGGDGGSDDTTETEETTDSGDGGTSGSITIGLQADMTGVLASYGYWHKRVVEGYVEELNANGGINGMEVVLETEDTATDSKQGVQAFRKLVQQSDADIVIGSQSSGVSIATNPLAKQLQTPYFPIGEAPSITGEDANRWVVRNNHNTNHAATIGVQYGLENLGSKWTVMYQDYAFGQQYNAWVKQQVNAGGGEILTEIPVPVGASDLNSYLNKVPDDTEVLFNALVGPSALNFLKQSADLGTPGARLGPIASVEGVDVSGVGEGAEGASYVTMLPRRLAEFDNEFNRHLRETARVSESDKVLNGGHYFVSYEALSWIKEAAEAVDWQGSDDHQAFVEWFESGPSVEHSNAYPQGPKFFRGQDHQAFMNMFIEKIDGGKLTVAQQIDVTEPSFEASIDLTSQSF